MVAGRRRTEDRTIQTWLTDVFGRDKVAIGMVHVPALPGSPLYDEEGGMALVRERTLADLRALQAAGFDAVMFCNENDRPYVFEVGAETVAAMAAVVGGLREVFTGAYGSDFGFWNTAPGEALRYRRQIGAANVRILNNIVAEFAAPVAARPIDVVARGAALISLADAICVSGVMTGSVVDRAQLQAVREVLPDTVLFANTGVNEANVGDILSVADGVVVGTSLKVDGITWNPVDEDRARSFMARVDAARAPALSR